MAMRIALADDQLLVRQDLTSWLERQGFHVVREASEGQEAQSIREALAAAIPWRTIPF
jgi:DNA-binding NarL/FixJ family response regulator